ncbi:hypothetical protein ACV4SH_004255, partial [Shigella sonnei]
KTVSRQKQLIIPADRTTLGWFFLAPTKNNSDAIYIKKNNDAIVSGVNPPRPTECRAILRVTRQWSGVK